MSISSTIFAQLSEMPVTTSLVVGTEHLDPNNHMNVLHYLDFGSQAMWKQVSSLGMDENYIAESNSTTFVAEQHVQYFAETYLDEVINISAIVVARGEKSLHLAAFLLNSTQAKLACVVESAAVHVDFTTRRPAPFPSDIAAAIDSAITSRPLADLPLSGAIHTRRRPQTGA